MLGQIAPLERRGQKDPRIALAIVQVHRHDQLAPRQRLGGAELRAASVGEREAPVAARAGAADAVRVGKREQRTCITDRALVSPAGALPPGLPLEVAGCAPRSLQSGAVGHGRPLLGAQDLEPGADVRVARRRDSAQQIALGEQRRELCGEWQLSQRAGAQQHVRQARMRPETCHLASVGGDASAVVERPETLEQLPGARELRRGRRVEPAKRRGLPHAPAGELQRERREIGVDDLGRRVGREARVGTLAPRPVADARLEAPGAAAALIRGRPRDAPGREQAHAGYRIEARATRESRVDDHAHARDGETGFGDVGREHHFARTGGRGGERGILLLAREISEQRHDLNACGQLRGGKRGVHAPDLARAGQERQHVAALLAQCPEDEL